MLRARSARTHDAPFPRNPGRRRFLERLPQRGACRLPRLEDGRRGASVADSDVRLGGRRAERPPEQMDFRAGTWKREGVRLEHGRHGQSRRIDIGSPGTLAEAEAQDSAVRRDRPGRRLDSARQGRHDGDAGKHGNRGVGASDGLVLFGILHIARDKRARHKHEFRAHRRFVHEHKFVGHRLALVRREPRLRGKARLGIRARLRSKNAS